jgi:hypothetical protein
MSDTRSCLLSRHELTARQIAIDAIISGANPILKLFLKRLLNCATRNEIEKARSGYFATGLASSLQ